MMTDPQSDLDLALRAAQAAGRAIRAAYQSGQEVRYKGPDQPVTDADLAADLAIRQILLGDRPDDGWLSEETADSPARLGRERLWVVDPIDGTSSFVAGRPESVVSIGLVEGGAPVLGVVYNPITRECYHATAGGGAFLDGRPLRVTARDVDAGELTLLASRSEIREGDVDCFRGRWTFRPLGSTAYKMVKVAEGAGDAFVSFGPKHEWDVCAAQLIVAEAGGRVTDLEGHAFRYNQPHPSWRGVVASNGRVHERLLEVIRSTC